jgi:metal-responsive CopG/Arc/MetJ family transcriptional regulator
VFIEYVIKKHNKNTQWHLFASIISLPEDIFKDLSDVIGSRKRSRFISQAIERSLRELKEEELAKEYKEAAAEIRRVNQDLEGTLGDGID